MANQEQEQRNQAEEEEESDSDDSDVAAFTAVDFSGVDFDAAVGTRSNTTLDSKMLECERRIAFSDYQFLQDSNNEQEEESGELVTLVELLKCGRYPEILLSDYSKQFFQGIIPDDGNSSVVNSVRQQVFSKASSVVDCVKMEILGIAALNLFLQANYTGPSLEDDDEQRSRLEGINPHPCFVQLSMLASEEKSGGEKDSEQELTISRRCTKYHNAILADLAVDGEWPVQVCYYPYFLLLARSILLPIADPSCTGWSSSESSSSLAPTARLAEISDLLVGSRLWSVRAAVAHERLLQSPYPSTTLSSEVERNFAKCIASFCQGSNEEGENPNPDGAVVMLEWGLAEHHFDRKGKGRASFIKAQQLSGLAVEVTGAMGKRTKFQQKATAQMLVRATSAAPPATVNPAMDEESKTQESVVEKQMIEHSEDGILLERIKFDDERNSEIKSLSQLDQAILLALCLDVKNSNPADGLTAEEMGAFLARVLDHHDDWMIYATALLERAWLEFERTHARERAILQMQALADQHTNRLTITQSTRQSVDESAPVQERLKNLHVIVYPPRWSMIEDLAERYANMGIVTSAAELYTEIEFWSEVVDCYRRAGRLAHAEKIVRERLAVEETPRMWEALGLITNDPVYFEKAIAVSQGRYSSAYMALGAYYFEKGELEAAFQNYETALKLRPLVPSGWFRLGTISMRLERWDMALRAFSEVVQQVPDEAEAWANVAAIHMHNKHPAEAYPALVESLKYSRNNWRVWLSKLYTCLDLQKYDEAIQACNVLLDLRTTQQASAGIPPLEERCVRAIVGGTLKVFQESQGDDLKLESSRRTLSRVHELLDRISSSSDAEPWIYEATAVFQEEIGQNEKVLESLLKEYRALQTIPGWETSNETIQKVCQVVSHIVHLYCRHGTSDESVIKARFIVRGVIKKIETARPGDDTIPDEVKRLGALLSEIEGRLTAQTSS